MYDFNLLQYLYTIYCITCFYAHGHPKKICQHRLTGIWCANMGSKPSLLDYMQCFLPFCNSLYCKSNVNSIVFRLFKMLVVLATIPCPTPCKSMFNKQLIAQILLVNFVWKICVAVCISSAILW